MHKIITASQDLGCSSRAVKPKNIFEQEPETPSELERLRRKYDVPLDYMKIIYSSDSLNSGQDASLTNQDVDESPVAFLSDIGLDELIEMARVSPVERDIAGDFLFSLRDAFIAMINAIIERHEDCYQQGPFSFPEYEIYDSVVNIIEDSDLEELNVALGGEPGFIAEVLRANKHVFYQLQKMTCQNTPWRDNVIIPEYLITYQKGRAVVLPSHTEETLQFALERIIQESNIEIIKPRNFFWMDDANLKVIALVRKYLP